MCLELSTDLWGRQIAQTQVSEKSNIKAQREDENEGKPSSRELGMYSDGPQMQIMQSGLMQRIQLGLIQVL